MKIIFKILCIIGGLIAIAKLVEFFSATIDETCGKKYIKTFED